MHLNNQFQMRWAERMAAKNPEARFLDYGCGAGNLVGAARERGIQMFGAEVYHMGNRDDVLARGPQLEEGVVREIKDNMLDFEDDFFDFATSNMVWEHVHDLKTVAEEMARVIKPGGQLLHLFPTVDVVREGHIGIPFAHRFKQGSKLRYWYTYGLRALGLGHYKDDRSLREWTRSALEYVDTKTCYRTLKEIKALFDPYFTTSTDIESEYLHFRLEKSRRLRMFTPIANCPITRPLTTGLLHRLGARMWVSQRKTT
jgi:SAM-dependent methyltransferase